MKTTIKYHSFHLSNRWKKRKRTRAANWVCFGFSTDVFNPNAFEYKIHFFGLDFRFWFTRNYELKKKLSK